MAKKSTQMRWIVVVGGIAFFGVLLYSTLAANTEGIRSVCELQRPLALLHRAWFHRGRSDSKCPRHRLRTNHQRARRINGLQRRPTSERPPSQVAVSGDATSVASFSATGVPSILM